MKKQHAIMESDTGRLHLQRLAWEFFVSLHLDAGVVRQIVKLVDGRLGLGVPQEVLGAEVDEGLAELAVDLAAQQVEVVGGGGHVCDLPVGALDLVAKVAAAEPVLLRLGHLGELVRVLVAHLSPITNQNTWNLYYSSS
eukprot:scaffold127235_cov23-Prasinocladus_malaysianus.AAC.1